MYRPKLPELPELPAPSLPSWIEEDENFLAAKEVFSKIGTKAPPKQLEFDNKGRLIKNPNNGFQKNGFLGTYLDKD